MKALSDVVQSGDAVGGCLYCVASCTGTCGGEVVFERIKALETRLAADEAQVRLLTVLLNHVGRGLQMVDAFGHVVVANDLAVELVGVPAAFFATKPHVDDVLALQWQSQEFVQVSEELKAQFQKPMATSTMRRYRRPRPNGRIVEVETVPLADGGMVRIHTDVTERHEDEQRIAHLAQFDYLTGLHNRASFQAALEDAVRSHEGIALLLIDVDRFKEINDAFGHPVGDALLIEIAARLRANVRSGDMAARVGGDEFALIMRGITAVDEAQALAGRLVSAASEPFIVAGNQCTTGVSVGVAIALPHAGQGTLSGPLPVIAGERERSELLRHADLALYAAKTAGRGRWRCFDPTLQQVHKAEQILLQELRVAITANQFEVYYQPVIDLASGRVTAFVALPLWHHPDRGLLAAVDFVPSAEVSGLILQLGGWVLRQACQDAASWPPDVRVLVNISPQQFGSVGLSKTVGDALTAAGLAASRLELVIPETSLVLRSQAIGALMSSLRALGIRIALDDFGTGYWSLLHLRQFTFDTIKINRAFVTEATVLPASAAIVRALSSLAADLGLCTIAEGVETDEQLALLRQVGCREVQSDLFTPPRPAGAVAHLLARLNSQTSPADLWVGPI